MNKILTALLMVLLSAGYGAADALLTQAAANSVPAAAGLSTRTATAAQAVIEPASGTITVKPAADDIDEGQAAYDSLTNTADFNYRPAFVETRYAKNELFQDIAVSAVEAVPFGFLLTFAGIFVYEWAAQGTIQPKLKTLQEYTPVYAISIGSLAALNVVINTLFFYDYKKENPDDEKTEEK